MDYVACGGYAHEAVWMLDVDQEQASSFGPPACVQWWRMVNSSGCGNRLNRPRAWTISRLLLCTSSVSRRSRRCSGCSAVSDHTDEWADPQRLRYWATQWFMAVPSSSSSVEVMSSVMAKHLCVGPAPW